MVLWNVLRVMQCLVKKSSAAVPVAVPEVQRKLVCLVHGWGGREEGLGFLAIAQDGAEVRTLSVRLRVLVIVIAAGVVVVGRFRYLPGNVYIGRRQAGVGGRFSFVGR